MAMHFRQSLVFEQINLERLKRSSEVVSRARELVNRSKRQIEESMELAEEFDIKKSRMELLRTTYKTGTDARKAARERAETLKNDARRLRNRLARLDRGAAQAKDGHQLERLHKDGDEVVCALKQTLSDLESVRMTLPDEPTLQKLKIDIRRAIARSESNNKS